MTPCPLTACSPGWSCFSGLKVHITGSCPILPIHQPPSPSWQGCPQSILCLAHSCTKNCPSPRAGPCPWPCWAPWGLHSPLLPFQVSLDAIPNLQHVTAPHSLMSPANYLDCTQSRCPHLQQKCQTVSVPTPNPRNTAHFLILCHIPQTI